MIYVSTKAYKYQKVHLMIWIFNKKHKIQSPSLEDYVSLKLPYLLNRREVFFNENMTEQIDEETSKEIISLYAEKNSELLNRKNLLISAYSPNFFDILVLLFLCHCHYIRWRFW